MKLKGKATFELTNVETGEKRVIEEENMITNAFQYLVQGFGVYAGTIHQRALSPDSNPTAMSGTNYNSNMLRKMTNGLVLFNDKLEEDPDHIFLTADDPDVVGVGADLAYIGNQIHAGSYNKTESGAIENGYKHVWDFTTSQANGDIGCACLTTVEGAGLGFGLPYSVSDWKGRLEYINGGHSIYLPYYEDYTSASSGRGIGWYVDEERNRMIRIKDYYSIPICSLTDGSNEKCYVTNEPDINGNIVKKKVFDRTFIYKKSIDLNVYRCPFNNVSIFDKLYYTSKTVQTDDARTASIYYGDKKLLETVTVNMPSDLAALIPDDIVQASINSKYLWTTAVNIDDGFMYISFIIPKAVNKEPSLASGDKVYTWKINMETFESTWFSITNTTGQTLSPGMSTFFSTLPFLTVTNNYTVLYSSSGYGNAWIIDNATGSTIKQVTDSEGNIVSISSSNIRGTFSYKDIITYVYKDNTAYFLNLKTGIRKIAYCENTFVNDYTYPGGITHGTKFPKMFTRYLNTYSSIYSNCYLILYVNPQILTTINNLEDVVTKTSAETMKVTYIITEEAEE